MSSPSSVRFVSFLLRVAHDKARGSVKELEGKGTPPVDEVLLLQVEVLSNQIKVNAEKEKGSNDNAQDAIKSAMAAHLNRTGIPFARPIAPSHPGPNF